MYGGRAPKGELCNKVCMFMYVIKPLKRRKTDTENWEHRVSHRIQMKLNTFCDLH